ncbi:Set1C complex protein, partial [Hortaea werneckii]
KPKKGASKAALTTAPPPITLPLEDQDVREGDVIGLELQLPSLNLHRKIVTGVYNPAVDIGDGFDDIPTYTRKDGSSGAANHEDETVAARDIIRDRIPVPYKGNSYFEIIDHVPSKPMEIYTDRQTNLASLSASTPTATVKDTAGVSIALKAPPNPNHEYASLRTLPHSALRVYKNGRLIGTAFENLLAFLPPASAPSRIMGAREGFDDGYVGYFPAVACFGGGVAEVNFGGDGKKGGFWCPPEHVRGTTMASADASAGAGAGARGWNPGRTSRLIGERYREQVAEDVVWDVLDEVDFFMQDGGEVGDGMMAAAEGGGGGGGGKGSRLKQEV